MLSFFLSTLALSAHSSRTMTTSSTTTTTTTTSSTASNVGVLSPDALQNLVDTASSWCASHGVLMGARDAKTRQPLGDYLYEPAPFSLYPTPFPKTAFEKAYDMAKPFNEVVHEAASQHPTWLLQVLKEAAAGDPDFTGKLVELAKDVLEKEKVKPRAQSLVLGVLRSDYMLHAPPSAPEIVPLQVELNTIASSFGCLSAKLSQLHQHLYGESASLPQNGAADGIAKGLAKAVEEYKRQKKDKTTAEPVVVMVVQPGETNSCDQRDLEFLLQQQYGVRMVRQTLQELATTATTTPDDSSLLLASGKEEAAVVYYRAGYTPTDYPTAVEWEGRSKVEHSSAIKCPDVFYHLFGTKKVQQVLANPTTLRKFCSSEEMATLLESTFAGLYSLGGDDDEVVNMALNDPEGFVLKPQREGGGNNLYHQELVDALKSMSKEERGAFILMQKILPPASTAGALVRRGKVAYDGDVVCELGVFGISLRSYDAADSPPLMNEVVGHILRAKSTKTDEGGVAAGYAFLSSPKLE